MDYRIEKRDAFRLVCKKKQLTKAQAETVTDNWRSAFWNECAQNGVMQEICKYGRFDHFQGVLGVNFSTEMADAGYPYGVGAEYNGAPFHGSALDIVEIPAQTYAIFQCRGKMPDAFVKTYQQIVTEFFPQSNYEYGTGVELEVYPSDDTDNPDYVCEMWIAVTEKK